ncbi:MAG: hypothetical protein WAQ28_16710 [Bacteroidia bacterium]
MGQAYRLKTRPQVRRGKEMWKKCNFENINMLLKKRVLSGDFPVYLVKRNSISCSLVVKGGTL